MNAFHKETLRSRILKLAALKGTGTPLELAVRLGISERSLKRIVKEIRDDGIYIRYCKKRGSYVTDDNIY